MNTVGYFEIQAENISRAVKFYGGVFGWKFTQAPGMAVEYWRISGAGPNGGLMKKPAQSLPVGSGANAFICSVQVEDFDSVAEKILLSGGKVALTKFAVPGTCWQGYFLDTEGNTFGLFEVDPNAA
jgi:predicted enzyme related to lactoylglutathione lyase